LHPRSGANVVVKTGKVTSTGHPSKSFPSEILKPSEQQPYNVALHTEGGHPSFLGPVAGVTPSEQQLCSVSLQVCTSGQPKNICNEKNLLKFQIRFIKKIYI